MNSAIYTGKVRHRRMRPVKHEFSYRIFMMYLDLAEIPGVLAQSRLISAERRAIARFCREDYLGDPAVPLDTAVRDLVELHTGKRPYGPIRLLTQLRYLGYVFNPVSFYYCFSSDHSRVEAIVAEVSNTPWREKHHYVLDGSTADGSGVLQQFRPDKAFHVSPFMPMDVDYDWRISKPDELLTVHMQNSRAGAKLFDATLVLERQEFSAANLRRVLLRFPLMTLRIFTSIYWQALRLWWKKAPFYDHPSRKAPPDAAIGRRNP
jgi:DUF1365 family protein